MLYRTNLKNGDEISQLAFGCMRFRNEADAEKQIKYAASHGVNYYDTAYIYPGSEAMLGRVLERLGIRDKIKIATKLPPYLTKKYSDFDKILNTQLERLKTDYIDYYLIHMLTNIAEWERVKSFGILDWLKEKKEAGIIKNLGFSFHGVSSQYLKLIEAYDWDFSMVQYNYLDENNQAGKAGIMRAAELGIPIMVMEPLRGGKLVRKLPKSVEEVFRDTGTGRSPAEWAFRWVLNHPEVLTVLSGMNSDEMVKENVRTFSEAKASEFTEAEFILFDKVKEQMKEIIKNPCTGCGYCMPCPAGVDIPFCFSCYNDTAIEGRLKAKVNYIMRGNKHAASQCTKCGKCEKHCPQSIEVRSELVKVKKTFEGGIYRPMRSVVRKFLKLEK